MTQTAVAFERLPLRQFAEKAYLDYSMYVILDRALPHLADGLKPVQRRIVYAMSELGLTAGSKPKKSARTIGDVIGKFHPHGDTACYEALVLMAQPFAYRYPLVDGQGNFGSPDDPKSFAAMRYTESRLTPYARVLLDELDQGTVDWQPNFDGTLKEPRLLPARLPNVLLNGASGIAVGMATDIPPHNLKEVVAALIHLIDEPKADTRALMEHIKGPDFPTAAEIITPPDELLNLYETGNGSVRTRAVYEREDSDIVITALPYQVSPARVLQQIDEQMKAKKLPLIEDLRDESDHENPTRLVLVPRSSRIDVERLMAHLFATTDLERSHRVNINLIGLDGRPQVYGLKPLLEQWLAFRQATVRRRLEHRLDQVIDRLHILAGLLIAYLNIDEVIRIIRTADEPKAVLMSRFQLTGTQADAILDLKLRHLARLEEIKIRGEQQELEAERATLKQTLGSTRRLKSLIKQELLADAERHGDARRAPLARRPAAQAISDSELTPSEPVTVILSAMGWARLAKGHDIDPASLAFRTGDRLLHAARGRSNQQAVFVDHQGRAYALPAHQLPSARGHGEPLTSRLQPPTGATFAGVVLGEDEDQVLLASDFGYGFQTRFSNLISRQRAGKQLVTIPAGARLLPPAIVLAPGEDLLIIATSGGRLLCFPLNEVPELARGKGNKLIQIPPKALKAGERAVGILALPEGGECLLWAGAKYLRLDRRELQAYLGSRAQRGTTLPRGYQKVTALVAV